MRALCFSISLCALASCGWPATRMEPVADYAARARPTVSAAPAYTAGPTDRRTYSPDGSTLFVCADGGTEAGGRVTPGAAPAC